jgi:site-specific DNA-methyltransferase (adenine-specific)
MAGINFINENEYSRPLKFAKKEFEVKLIKGDCITESDKIESESVDLILTDLPFGTMKNLDAEPIRPDNDRNYVAGGGYKKGYEWDNIIEPKKFYEIANRILRKNGKMILFCQEPFTRLLLNEMTSGFVFNYRAIWLKNDFANCLFSKKAMVNYYEDILIFTKINPKNDYVGVDYVRNYFQEERKKTNLSYKEINEKCFGSASNGGGMASNILTSYKKGWSFPSKEKYEALQKIGLCNEDYYKLKEIYYGIRNNYIDYENNKYPNVFNLWQGRKYKGNVLEYKKDYDGFHPTQKPKMLLEDLIKTFSNENDLIVDLTMGSCSTGIACINANRNFIGIELDENYYNISKKRVEEKRKEKDFNVVTSFGDGM